MTRLIRTQILFALLFLAIGALWSLYYYERTPDPPLLDTNVAFTSSANSIQDIEHLRKLLRTVTIGSDNSIVGMKRLVDAAVNLGVALCLVAAGGFALCASWARKLQKQTTQQSDAPTL
jgi:drug/metabolite transporter (DMT)-like permease